MTNKQPTIEQLAEAKDILDSRVTVQEVEVCNKERRLPSAMLKEVKMIHSVTATMLAQGAKTRSEIEQNLIKGHITKCNEVIKNLRIGIKDLTKTLDETIAMKRQFKKEIKNA